MAPKNIATMAFELAEPIAKQLSLEIWDVRFVKEGADWFLRYFIDREDGVGINDCEAFSKALDEPLDEADFIEQQYYLEVCSPGLGRELTRPEHFEKMKGQPVILRTYKAVDGQKQFSGVLEGLKDGNIIINDGENELIFPKESVSKVKLDDDNF